MTTTSLWTRLGRAVRLAFRPADAKAAMAGANSDQRVHQAGRVQTSGRVRSAEARHVEAPRLASSIGYAEFADSVVPGKELLQSVPLRYYGGAYRPDGTLIDETRLWRLLSTSMDCATLPYAELPEPSSELDHAVFGGTLFPHFGHLMVESTARAWWILENDPSAHLILQFQGASNDVPAIARRLFELADIRIHVVAKGTATLVRHLIVPEPSLVERQQAHPKFLRLFDTISENVGAGGTGNRCGSKLFVTRGKGVAQVYGEDAVAAELQRQGYSILDPTTTSLENQIRAFAGATHVVGVIGSAMHGIVFARQALQVAYLVRMDFVSTTFPSIDQACGRHEAHYLYVGMTPLPLHGSLDGPYLIDPDLACSLLKEAGFLSEKPLLSTTALLACRDDYMAEWARMARQK